MNRISNRLIQKSFLHLHTEQWSALMNKLPQSVFQVELCKKKILTVKKKRKKLILIEIRIIEQLTNLCKQETGIKALIFHK